MRHEVYLADGSAAADAAELIEHYGEHAAGEADSRARRSRDLGNVIHYCRWRQIGRMIASMGAGAATGTVH